MAKKFLKKMFASRSYYRAYLQTQKSYDFKEFSKKLNRHFPKMKFEYVESKNRDHSCILYFRAHKSELLSLERVVPEDILMSLEKI